MKKVIFLSCILISQWLEAQPVLSTAIIPLIGQTVSFTLHDTTGIVQGASGAAQSWTFSLSAGTAQSYTYVASAGTPYTAQFDPTLASAAYEFGAGNWVYSEPLIDFHDLYGFKNTADELIYTDPVRILNAPLTYNQLTQDICSGSFNIGGTAGTRTGTSDIYYDAYGTLVIDGITYNNAARLFHEENYTDVTGAGTTVLHIENFYWYDTNTMKRIFEINVTYNGSNIIHKEVKKYIISTGLAEEGILADFKILPNQISGTNALCMIPAQVRGTIRITSPEGRLVWQYQILPSAVSNQLIIPGALLSPGVYFITLQDAFLHAQTTQKLLVY